MKLNVRDCRSNRQFKTLVYFRTNMRSNINVSRVQSRANIDSVILMPYACGYFSFKQMYIINTCRYFQ